MSWYREVITDPSRLYDALNHFENEFQNGRDILNVENKTIWNTSKALPGWMAFKYEQYREICAIFDFFDLEAKRILTEKTKFFIEQYPRQLSDRMAQQYAEGTDEVIEIRQLLIEIKLMAEKFEGLTRGLSALNYQVTTLAKMRAEGIEDATI